ncbi:MAG: hypothetical protein ACLQPD_19175, partial [Desulfomonilaceae bacterium]
MVFFTDLLALAFCAVMWLGPMIYNCGRGRFNLLHPLYCVPLIMIYLPIAIFIYRSLDGPILITASWYEQEEGFLAAPLLISSLAAIFYFLGIKLSGLSLKLDARDAVSRFVSLPAVRGLSSWVVFLCAFVVFSLAACLQLYVGANFERGTWWAFVFFTSVFILPVPVMNQNRTMGLGFLLLNIAGSSALWLSKGSFLHMVLPVIVFYQHKLASASKSILILVLGAILLTPYAVERYGSQDADLTATGWSLDAMRSMETPSWNDTLMTMLHREYAFESFAIVFQRRIEGEPLHWGAKTLEDLSYMIPTLLWPEKPRHQADFPSEYLQGDWRQDWGGGWSPHFFSRPFLDFGIPGCCAAIFMVGLLYGYAYRRARDGAINRGVTWPLLLYLPLVINAHPLMSAGPAFPATVVIGQLCGLGLLLSLCHRFKPSDDRLYVGPHEEVYSEHC